MQIQNTDFYCNCRTKSTYSCYFIASLLDQNYWCWLWFLGAVTFSDCRPGKLIVILKRKDIKYNAQPSTWRSKSSVMTQGQTLRSLSRKFSLTSRNCNTVVLLMIHPLHCRIPVSYTHLDVYKRQVLYFLIQFLWVVWIIIFPFLTSQNYTLSTF